MTTLNLTINLSRPIMGKVNAEKPSYQLSRINFPLSPVRWSGTDGAKSSPGHCPGDTSTMRLVDRAGIKQRLTREERQKLS